MLALRSRSLVSAQWSRQQFNNIVSIRTRVVYALQDGLARHSAGLSTIPERSLCLSSDLVENGAILPITSLEWSGIFHLLK